MENETTGSSDKPCRLCLEMIHRDADQCKHCSADLRWWGRRHPLLSIGAVGTVVLAVPIFAIMALAIVLPNTVKITPKHMGSSQWDLKTGQSPMDDSPTVRVSVEADQEVSGKSPRLVVNCEGRKLSIYIDTQWQLGTQDDDGRTAVRYRFDGGQPISARPRSSVNQEAIFFDQPDQVMKRMSRADALLVEYRSLTWGSQTARFAIAGFDGAAPDLKRCLAH